MPNKFLESRNFLENEDGDIVPPDDVEPTVLETRASRVKIDARRELDELHPEFALLRSIREAGKEIEAGSCTDGVAVSLAERAEALHDLSKIYAGLSRSAGMLAAVEYPGHRARLGGRYSNPKEVAQSARERATQDQVNNERPIAERFLRSEELKRAGFDSDEVDSEAQLTVTGLRQVIGESRRQKDRDKFLKNLNSLK